MKFEIEIGFFLYPSWVRMHGPHPCLPSKICRPMRRVKRRGMGEAKAHGQLSVGLVRFLL
jgi:hypothetical protein